MTYVRCNEKKEQWTWETGTLNIFRLTRKEIAQWGGLGIKTLKSSHLDLPPGLATY